MCKPIDTDNRVEVIATKYNVRCKTCGTVWGKYVLANGEMPENWNICLKCFQKELDKSKKEEKEKGENEYIRTTK